MNLRNPWFLALLLPAIAWLVFSLFRHPVARISPLYRLKKVASSWRLWLWWLPEACLFLFLATGVVLLAGPQRPLAGDSESAQGLAIAIALDRSGSMAAIIAYQGKELSRLDGVKAVTRDFLDRRPHDQFALISFARYPETHTPLTANRQIVVEFLDLITVQTKPEEGGTAIGDALILASARLSQQGSKKGTIILLTDGQNNQGEKSPTEAAAVAKAAGIPVYCVALGGDGYIVQDTPAGRMAQSVPESIDEESLTAIAQETGGRYYHAQSPDDLQGFYADIARRETQKLEQSRPQTSELDLESGLWLMLAFLAASLLCRHLLLRRMDQ